MSNSNSLNKCSANETAACCCVDVGTIIDNEDCTAEIEQTFTTEAEATAKLAALTKRARDIESDPCVINSNVEKTAEGVKLIATFAFACEAENLIFQLGLR